MMNGPPQQFAEAVFFLKNIFLPQNNIIIPTVINML